MKKIFVAIKHGWLAVILGMCVAPCARAQTNFTVTTPNYIYAVNDLPATGLPGFFVQNSPTLTLTAGNNYIFNMDASLIHPMVIVTNSGDIEPDLEAYTNATPIDVSVGTIVLSIPATNFPSTLYYQCNAHGFFGVINVVAPSNPLAPPANIIIALAVGTNVVMTSKGTNSTFTLVPQYNSNLVSGVWQNVPSFTNSFSNGTNTTIFDRLEPICGPNVYLRISQQPPH